MPKVGKLMQVMEIILLYLDDLSTSEDIIGIHRAKLSISKTTIFYIILNLSI